MPPTGTPGLAPSLHGPRHNGSAAGADGNLLVNDLDHLFPAIAPPLDRQHRISRRAYKLDS